MDKLGTNHADRRPGHSTLKALLSVFEVEDQARELGRLAPEQVPAVPADMSPGGIVNIWGPYTTQNTAPGRRRGELEETLRHLQTFGADEVTVVGGDDENDWVVVEHEVG